MQSFDQSLKYLLHHAPADFIRFGSDDPRVRVIEPVPTVLPSRGRDVDGAYLIALGGAPENDAELRDEHKRVAHVELHRRHQSLDALGADVAEAQVRLNRREKKLVISHVWDLYGDTSAPLLEKRTHQYGEDSGPCVYRRVNLRALGWAELLAQAPPSLWPLVALTRDGASEPAIEETRDAIEARTPWTQADRSDHLAVLWFVAEAEGVSARLMQEYLTKERLMESQLYKEIFGDGKAEGKAEGRAEGKAEGILAVLATRDISVSDAIRERILSCTDGATLDAWIRRAAVASTAAGVVRATTPPRVGRARKPATRGRER
jgi:hypothetical protein